MSDAVECHAELHHAGDVFAVGKVGHYAPVMRVRVCQHGIGQCPYPLLIELPVVPRRILSPRVLQAIAKDELEELDGIEEGAR